MRPRSYLNLRFPNYNLLSLLFIIVVVAIVSS